MIQINNHQALHERLLVLEMSQIEAGRALRESACGLLEVLEPGKMLLNSLKGFATSTEVKNEILGLSMGMGSGYIAKKFVIGDSSNPFKLMLGNLVGVLVSKEVAGNSEKIQSVLTTLVKKFVFSKSPEIAEEAAGKQP
jgi:hypothetical protein